MKKESFILIVFCLISFALAMTAFVFGGILDQVALSLNISVANSGLLNTMYSYGAAFGVPITLIVFRKIERSKMLKIMLVITILMSFALITVQSFPLMLLVRLMMGISANSYGVLAIATVMAVTAKEKQGRAMAFLIMGSSLALVIGIPLTRALSAALDWRSIFAILMVLMIFSLIIFILILPKGDHESTKIQLRNELRFFKDGKTLLLIIYTLFMFIGYNAFYTYVTPYLLEIFPSVEKLMSFVLVAFGIASFVGNIIGGHVSDRIGYRKSMLIGAILQLIFAILIFLTQPVMWLSIVMIVLWITSAWFTGLQLNTGIAQVTHNQSSFMISINSSAIQLGGAIGASISAVVIAGTGIENIVVLLLLTGILVTIIQLISIKKYN